MRIILQDCPRDNPLLQRNMDKDRNDDKTEEKRPGSTPENPLEDLQKQLEKLFGGKPLKFEFAGVPSPDSDSNASAEQDSEDEERALSRIRNFSMKPREIRDYLNRFVIKQDEAKKVLAVSICDHYNHIRRCLQNPKLAESEYGKQNILILGPTGVGKTYLMRTIARLIGVPFVKADATKFSETGYVGADVEDLVRDLVKAANGSVDLAQYGIIYIDEIDKIAGRSESSGKDVSGRGVQINLLKLMEESNVNVVSQQDMMGQMQMAMNARRGKKQKRTISTRHILFIVSGAFDKLGEDIARRMNKNTIGFSPSIREMEDSDPSDFLKFAETSDFIRYGFEAEFIGRLPVRVACESLKADDLANILVSSEGSILKQYAEDFKGYGIEFKITPEAISAIAKLAYREKTGARGLMTVLERTLRDFKFELPSSGIKSFEADTATVENPIQSLKKLLMENADLAHGAMLADLDRFLKNFKANTGYELVFDDSAKAQLVAEAVERDKSVDAVCTDVFKDFEHGLAIVSRNTGEKTFKIDSSCIKNPDAYLSDLVVKSFKKDGPVG